MNPDEFREFCASILGLERLDDDRGWANDEGDSYLEETWNPMSSLDDLREVEEKVVSGKANRGLGLGGRYFAALSKSSQHELDYVEKSESPDTGQIDFTISIYTDYISQLIVSPIEDRVGALLKIEDDVMRVLKTRNPLLD